MIASQVQLKTSLIVCLNSIEIAYTFSNKVTMYLSNVLNSFLGFAIVFCEANQLIFCRDKDDLSVVIRFCSINLPIDLAQLRGFALPFQRLSLGNSFSTQVLNPVHRL